MTESRKGVSVKDIIETFHGDAVTAGRALHSLEAEGKITIEAPYAQGNLRSSFFSFYNLRFWVVTVLVLATVASIYALPQSEPATLFRYFLGSLFVLYLPGHSLVETLFAKKELDQVERLALSIGLSLVIVPMVGLVLNYSPWGLTLAALVSSLALLTLSLSGLASVQKLTTGERKVIARGGASKATLKIKASRAPL